MTLIKNILIQIYTLKKITVPKITYKFEYDI